MTHSRWLFAALALAAVTAPADAEAGTQGASSAPIYRFEMKRLDGKPQSLGAYAGKVMLVVNTASKCGLTPQYQGLQQLHERYGAKGLAVLGFPANDFLWQEPGGSAQIAEFCSLNYGVSFPMFEKIAVKGKAQAPLYKYLTSKDTNPRFAGAIGWNFEKFLVGRNGEVVARFSPKTPPTAPEVIAAIEAAIAARPGGQ